MEYIGDILSDPDLPDISRERWAELIREHPNLVPPQPHEIINPFTKEAVIIRPRTDCASVVVGGKVVGSMSWVEDDSNGIGVFGEPEAVVPLARAIAGSLGGRFEENRNP
jgi:hypothetical protein